MSSWNRAGQNPACSPKAIAPSSCPKINSAVLRGLLRKHRQHCSLCSEGPMSSASRHVAPEEGMRMCQTDIVILNVLELCDATGQYLICTKVRCNFALFKTSEDFEYHFSD